MTRFISVRNIEVATMHTLPVSLTRETKYLLQIAFANIYQYKVEEVEIY